MLTRQVDAFLQGRQAARPPSPRASAVVSFGVAAAKVALIFWFFMQLRTEKGLIRVFAVGAIAWLAILLTMLTIDNVTR